MLSLQPTHQINCLEWLLTMISKEEKKGVYVCVCVRIKVLCWEFQSHFTAMQRSLMN